MDNFLPRELPKRKDEKINKNKNRKSAFFVLAVTVIASFGLWFLGSRSSETIQLPIGINTVTPTTIPTPTPFNPAQEVIKEINNLTSKLTGSYGLNVYNLTTKTSFGISENQTFSAASLMKMPLIITLYKNVESGKIDLQNKYILRAADKRGGAGSMYYKPAGTVYTYQKMVELMGQLSDNTAFNVFRNLLGDEQIQKTINDLGMSKTNFTDFETTPADMGILFRKLYSGSIVTRDHRDEILGYLTKTFDESRIPAGVPVGIRVAHKVGTDIGVASDGGIVFASKPYVVVIMSDKILTAEANTVLPKISSSVWEFENK
jgi:beta-lactamase class A